MKKTKKGIYKLKVKMVLEQSPQEALCFLCAFSGAELGGCPGLRECGLNGYFKIVEWK